MPLTSNASTATRPGRPGAGTGAEDASRRRARSMAKQQQSAERIAAATAQIAAQATQATNQLRDAMNRVASGAAGSTTATQRSLLDVNMPKMDGYTCVGELRGQDATSRAPIVMISTEDAPVDAEKAYAAGANLYLVKPVAGPRLIRLALMLTGGDDADAGDASAPT
jgi:two-component system, chemotaxis family, chemotaxis protein CheY